MATLRRRTPSTAKPVAQLSLDIEPVKAKASASPKKPLRRVISIKAVDTPKRDTRKAYTPASSDSVTGTDHAAVVERYLSKIKNPRTAIRARCVQCCNGQLKEVQLCPVTTCALHSFRMGENIFNKRTAARLAREQAEGHEEDNGIDENGEDE